MVNMQCYFQGRYPVSGGGRSSIKITGRMIGSSFFTLLETSHKEMSSKRKRKIMKRYIMSMRCVCLHALVHVHIISGTWQIQTNTHPSTNINANGR